MLSSPADAETIRKPTKPTSSWGREMTKKERKGKSEY
jgi:hypothetical protein